jgi:short-subunit dehydrogenase
MDIQDKVVIITGASQGIGLATAKLLASHGAKVVLAARSADLLEQAASELQQQGAEVLPVPTDMRDEAQIKHMVDLTLQRFGRVDVLINNAGQSVAGRIAELDLDDFRQIVELNLVGVISAIQAVLPAMRRQGGGMILNISSMTSKMNIPGLAGYASTKAALNLITQTARVELASENIRVITVLPRTTETNFGKNALGDQQMRQRQRSAVAEHRIVVDSPEYVAERILLAIQEEPAEQYMDDQG